jgi:hypothetical protein
VETDQAENGHPQPKAIPVSKAVLHTKPDLDAITAYWLAKSHSETFPGIEKAPIEFWPAGTPPPDGRSCEAHEAEGTICFDVGEGRFDHHPHGKCLDKCATDLVADYLGLTKEVALQQILGFIRMHDLEGPMALTIALRRLGVSEEIIERADLLQSFSLYSVVDSLRSRHHGKEQSLINEVCAILDREYRKQVYFWTVVFNEFATKAKIHPIDNGQRLYKVAVIESLEHRVGSFSRTREGGFCAACIHRNPKTGHTFISGHLGSDRFIEIGKPLRVWDMQKAGIDAEFDQGDLEESKFKLQQVWYLPRNNRGEVFIVMNGGEKATDIEPSNLSLEEILAGVHLGLDEEILSDSCPRTHCLLNQCPFYPFFFARCKKIREQVISA